MSRRSTRNTRMTPARKRKKQFFAEVNARGGRERWAKFSKWIGLFMRTAIMVALVVGAYFAITRGWETLFWRNPDYALKEVTVRNDGTSLTREQIIAASGVKPGQNILSYSLPEIEESLRKLPQVDGKPVVQRSLPNRMEIWIKERKPVAWITQKETDQHLVNPKSYLVDKDGAWFRPKQVLHEYRTLPVIVGVQTDNLEPKKPVHSMEMMLALELIKRNFQARSFDITKGYCVDVKDQNGTLITFGLDDLEGQLARLEQVREVERKLSQQVATVNLMLSRNIPIKWVPPVPPEDADFPPKPVDTAKPTTKDLKAKQVKKPEPKKELKKEPKKPNPDSSLYKPFLLRA